METLIKFFNEYGLGLTLIAIASVIILGIMKYSNMFVKLDEDKRHAVYLAISMGLSIIATIIYLVIKDKFEADYFIAVVSGLFLINQTAYNVFKVTKLKDLFTYILDRIKELLSKVKT